MQNQLAPVPAIPEPQHNDLFYSQRIHLLVRNRQTVVFDNEVAAVTTKNEHGVLDIIPNHTQFISIIKEYVIITKQDGSTQKLVIDTGIIRVVSNEVKIYLGIFSIASEKKK